MKSSELIEELRKNVELYGDLEVVGVVHGPDYYDEELSCWLPGYEVSAISAVVVKSAHNYERYMQVK